MTAPFGPARAGFVRLIVSELPWDEVRTRKERFTMRTHIGLSRRFAVVLGGILCLVCANMTSAQSQSGADRAIAKTDPCKLVTNGDIQTAIETKRNPTELAQLKARGIAWSISTKSVTDGEARRCLIHWQGNFGSVMQEKGDMAVTVSKAEYFKAEVSDLNRIRKRNGRPDLKLIPGVGDEAYYFGYSETGNPEARVGDIVVGVETLQGKASLDLLRAALARLK